MAKIIVTEFVSLDGVMEAPGNEQNYKHGGWVMRFPSPDQFQYKLHELLEHDALLLGRKTYEGFAAIWPSRSDEFADKMNAMPKYVASTTLKNPTWNNSSVLEGDFVNAIQKIKQHHANRNIMVAGSRTLVNSLRAHDLVDEYRLMVFPIVLGSGMRLFDDSPEVMPLTLERTQSFENGVTLLTYHRTRQPSTAQRAC